MLHPKVTVALIGLLLLLSSLPSLSQLHSPRAGPKIGNWQTHLFDNGFCRVIWQPPEALFEGSLRLTIQLLARASRGKPGFISLDIELPRDVEVYAKLNGSIQLLHTKRHKLRDNRFRLSMEPMAQALVEALSGNILEIGVKESGRRFLSGQRLKFNGFRNALVWIGQNCNVFTEDLVPGDHSAHSLEEEKRLDLTKSDWNKIAARLSALMNDPSVKRDWWTVSTSGEQVSEKLRGYILQFTLSRKNLYPSRYMNWQTLRALGKL